jgi:hypothetical protein
MYPHDFFGNDLVLFFSCHHDIQLRKLLYLAQDNIYVTIINKQRSSALHFNYYTTNLIHI